jgi:nicotinamidase-related amidase
MELTFLRISLLLWRLVLRYGVPASSQTMHARHVEGLWTPISEPVTSVENLGVAGDPKGMNGEFVTKQALLVIDVQNEYFTGKLPVSYPEGTLENIKKAMDRAYESHVPIAVIQHTSPPGSVTFRKGTPGWELNDEIRQRHFDILVEKTLPGSFTGTCLDQWLRDQNVTTVTIAGYMTHMCCDTTARQAFHLGYAVNFLSDATGTLSVSNPAGTISDVDLHRAIIVTQQMRFSRVMTTDDWARVSSCR